MGRARRLEASSFLYAIRPIATDLASTLLFYLILLLTGNARVAAAIGIGLAIVQVAAMRFRGRPIAPLQWASTAVIVVLGGLTVMTDDARFVLVKVTIFYTVFGMTMLRKGWMARYIPSIADGHIPARLMVMFERLWAALMIGTGALNLIVSMTADPRTVANIMAPVAIGSKLALFAVQYVLFRSIARPRIRAELTTPSN